jgi:hypothetical protein
MIEKIEHNWRNKFGKNNKRVGDVVESLVVSRLLQSGWEVFTNVSSVGLVDMCTLNIEKNNFYYIDVKSINSNYKSIEHFLQSGNKIGLTSAQEILGVKIAYYFDNRVYIIIDRKTEQVIVI